MSIACVQTMDAWQSPYLPPTTVHSTHLSGTSVMMKHNGNRLLLLVPAVLAIAGTASAQDQLKGRVFDSRTKAPLSGAVVTDSRGNVTTTTDGDGLFSLPCTGAMTIDVSRYGYGAGRILIRSCSDNVESGLTTAIQSLSAINVIGTQESVDLQKPISATTLTSRQLQRGMGLYLQDAINLTPGIRMERRTFGGGQRMIMRGYSNDRDAGNFTGTGYKAYINGIPITDAEGQTMLDDIDFATIGRLDAIRGPASSLYGTGIGGVLNMYTKLPDQPGTTVTQNTTSGQDGLLRSDTRLEYAGAASTMFLNVGHQKYDSYRVSSESKKDYLTFLGDFRVSDQQRISAFMSYSNSHDMRAGELDSAQFAQRLNTGEAKYIANGARSVVEGFRGGITHTVTPNSTVRNTATLFMAANDYEDVSSGGGLGLRGSQNFGLRNVLATNFTIGSRPLHGVTGGEFLRTNRSAQGYPMTNSIRGPIRSDVVTANEQFSLFTQWDLSLPRQLTLTAGASVNYVRYTIRDQLTNTGNPRHLDGSGRHIYEPVVTPTVALNRVFGDGFSAYVSVSQGYSPPTSGDAIIPYTGEPNDKLNPERATQYEIGTKGILQSGRLSYQIAFYNIAITDKLSPKAVFANDGTVLYSYTVNAGDQSNKGIEVAGSYALVQGGSGILSLLRPFVSYTYADYTYRNFRSDDNDNARTVDYTGRHVVGVAPNVLNAGLDVELRSGIYGNMTYQNSDQQPVSYDNLHKAVPFSLLDAKVGYGNNIGDRFRLDVSAGGHNLTNSLYFTQVFLNHKWDGAVPPNMYLPGPYKARYYGALRLSYRI